MTMISNNTDNITYLHVCFNPQFFGVVEPDFFEFKSTKILFDITRSYYNKYKQLPFDKNNRRSITQLQQYVEANDMEVVMDEDASREENLKIFYESVSELIQYDYESLDPTYISGNKNDGAFDAWLRLKSFTYGVNKAIRGLKIKKTTGDLTQENVNKIINDCMSTITQRGYISVINNDGYSFDDPEGHKQVSPENLIPSGFGMVDRWLSDDPAKYGGFEAGTQTMLWGASNVGKSIWLGSIGMNIANAGYNVVLVSNEMKEYKILKRLGANKFNISIGDYAGWADDPDKVMQRIRDMKTASVMPMGKLHVIQIPKCSPMDVERKVYELEQKMNVTFDVVMIDYFTNMGNDHGINPSDMYIYHKTNADDLASYAQRKNKAVISAHQLKIGAYDLDDMDLGMVSESSGIIHSLDNIWGIIQTKEMKANKMYMLKNLKSRDGALKDWLTQMDIDYNYMRLTGTDIHMTNEAYIESLAKF